MLYGYGVPAAAFWLGGHLLRRRGDDVPARVVDAAAILFTVLLGFLELRHVMNDGDVYRPGSGLTELALQVAVGLAIAIGLERIRARTGSVLLQAFYTIRSERQLMEQLQYNLLYRWFVGLGVDDPVWVPTVFGKNRDRLLGAEVARKFLAELLTHKEVRALGTRHREVRHPGR